MLDKYINRIMILSLVDVICLICKTYFAIITLYNAKYLPKRERRYFNQYFIVSVCYYITTFLKYSLITFAFSQGQIVKCYFSTVLMTSGAIGVVFYIPCIFVALLEAD